MKTKSLSNLAIQMGKKSQAGLAALVGLLLLSQAALANSSKPYIDESDPNFYEVISGISKEISSGELKCLFRIDTQKRAFGFNGYDDFRTRFSVITSTGHVRKIEFWTNSRDAIERFEHLAGLSEMEKCNAQFARRETSHRDLNLE